MRNLLGVLLLVGCNGDKDAQTDSGTEPTGPTFTLLGDASNLPPAALLSIWGSSSDDVFLVGADDGTGPVVLHWDGATWSRLQTGSTGDLWWVWSDGGDTVFMSGEGGRMLTWSRSAGTFDEQVITNAAYKLFGIWGASATDVYSVGGDVNGNLDGVVLHFDGSTWTEVANAPLGSDGVSRRQAFKVWGAASDDVWVVGTGALVMHWDGATWTPFPEPVYRTSPLTTISGRASDDIYAVGGFGNAIAVHWDGTSWVDQSPPPQAVAPFFNGVFASQAHGTVACGGNGSIWWHEDTGWEVDTRPLVTTRDFHACWIDEAGDVWAVGGDLTGLTEAAVIYGGDAVPVISL